MKNNKRAIRLAVLLAGLSLLISCGQKGDLYLPEGFINIDGIG